MHITQEQVDTFFSFLKPDRLRMNPVRSDTSLLEAAESDRGRVINSAAFRRLQQKAQVFPLEPNASVRSRLTHSFEVSQIGRYIAQKVIKNFESSENIHLPNYEKITAFVSTVETACLLHDIGNPPFGHLGEAAIQEWFRKLIENFSNETSKEQITNFQQTDLIKFDGNPQGFRIIRLLSGYDEFGLNLTCSLLLSVVKYPYTLSSMKNNKKIGLFESCYPIYKEACTQISWKEGAPFPYMLIMDVADEIAYSMSDLEDALEKKIISKDELLKVFKDFCNNKPIDIPKIFKGFSLDTFENQSFLQFKTSIIHTAVSEVADKYCSNLDKILSGCNDNKLLDSKISHVAMILKEVKRYAIVKIYSHASAEKIELAGRNIIQGLLKHFEVLLNLSLDKFNALLNGTDNAGRSPRDLALDFELRLFHRLPDTHIEKYKHCVKNDSQKELNHRAQLIVDYISGMTDDFALEMYQLLEGIRIQ